MKEVNKILKQHLQESKFCTIYEEDPEFQSQLDKLQENLLLGKTTSSTTWWRVR